MGVVAFAALPLPREKQRARSLCPQPTGETKFARSMAE